MATLPGWQMHPYCYWPPPIDSFAYLATSVSTAGAVDEVLVCLQTWICIPPRLWCCCSWCTQPVAYCGCRALMALTCCSSPARPLRIGPSTPYIPYPVLVGRIPPSAYVGEGSTRSYTVCWTHMRSWSSQQQVDSVRWSYVSYMTVHLVATWGLKRPMWLCKNVYGGPEWRPQLSSMLQPALYASVSRIGLHMALVCCSPWNLLLLALLTIPWIFVFGLP